MTQAIVLHKKRLDNTKYDVYRNLRTQKKITWASDNNRVIMVVVLINLRIKQRII